ncbi:VOC family protein [Amycolatopsis sp.]|uniref:VOC family protein n=1 Tax=Amycolatopsis sp. TaxID=37632 RepID=UPI002E02424F|nr:VOC family protein [Amycolatopsis sp.]
MTAGWWRMQVQELGHIVLYVHNLDRSVAFYRDVLGWNQLSGIDGGGKVALFSAPTGRTHHELLLIDVGEDAGRLPTGRHVGLYHFGLKIGDSDDQLREALQRLNEADAKVLGSSDHTVTHSLYVADPDGNEIELYIDVPGVDWRTDPSLIAAPVKPLVL